MSRNIWTFCECPPSSLTERTAAGGAVTAFQLTGHTCSAQRHDTASLNTHIFVRLTTPTNTCPTPQPPKTKPQAVEPVKANHSPFSTI